MVLKIKDIVIFVKKFHTFSEDLKVSAKSVLLMKHPQITKIDTWKFTVRQKKHSEFENVI